MPLAHAPRDLLFGKIALNKGYLSKQILNDALIFQRQQAPNRPLGDILLERGFLSRDQVDLILRIQRQIAVARRASSSGSDEQAPVPRQRHAPPGAPYRAPPGPGQPPPNFPANGPGPSYPGGNGHGLPQQGPPPGAPGYPPADPRPGMGSGAAPAAPGYPGSDRYPQVQPPMPGPSNNPQTPGNYAAPGPSNNPLTPTTFPAAPGPSNSPPTPSGNWPNAVFPQTQPPAPQPAPAPAPQRPPVPSSDPGDGDTAEALLGRNLGGCQIMSLIGAGGMGAIYRARHEALSKDVVVKVLPQKLAENPRTVERFVREARAAARLEHPNIVGVHDVGKDDAQGGVHYIIMQYVDGENLNELIRAKKKFAPKEALRIILEVAKGLEVAHKAGIIHRDIKAENILITTENKVRIADFGLAKDLGSDVKLTAEGQIIGTPLYMAPEIGRVSEIDGRVDVYSLGVTFYYMVTGVQPFAGFNTLDVLSGRAHEKIKPPDEVVPGLPPAIVSVIKKMMEKERDNRIGSADELIAALEEAKAALDAPGGDLAPAAAPGKTVKDARKRGRVGRPSGKFGRPASGRVSTPASAAGGGGGGLSPVVMAAIVIALVAVLGVVAFLLMAGGGDGGGDPTPPPGLLGP